MTTPIVLTKEGKQRLEEELRELKEIKRPEIIEKIEQAKEMGDLSENAEYHDAKDQQGWLAARIAEIEEILKRATLNEASISSGRIEIGTSFIVEDANGSRKELTIVGFNEADPLRGKISNESPMGKAFMRLKAGDTAEVTAPKGVIVYKILEIR